VKFVAWVIIAVFLPEQVAWALDYNWRGALTAGTAVSSSQAAVARGDFMPFSDPRQDKMIADSLRDVLSQLIGKNATDIQISKQVAVHRTTPYQLTHDKLNEIDAWMRDGDRSLVTCGSQALAGLLASSGQGVSYLQVSHYALLFDLLSDSIDIYTYNRAKRLENSLYALSKTALLFGAELKPFQWSDFDADNKEIWKALRKLIPFIAFVNDDHMVLVKGLSKDGLIIVDNGVEKIVERAEMNRLFSGYGLLRGGSDTYGLNITFLEEEVAKAIQGAKRTVHENYDFTSELDDYWDNDDDVWVSVAALGGSFVLGGLFSGAASAGSFANAGAQAMMNGMVASQISQATATMAVREWGMSASSAQVLGSVVAGGLGGWSASSQAGAVSGSWSQSANPVSGFMSQHPAIGAISAGAVRGGMTGFGQIQAAKYLQRNDNDLSKIFAPVVGSTLGYLGGESVLNVAGYQSNYTIQNRDIDGAPKWDTQTGEMDTSIRPSVAYGGGAGADSNLWTSVINNAGLALSDVGYRGYVVNQLIGNTADVMATRHIFDGEESPYSRVIGQSFGQVGSLWYKQGGMNVMDEGTQRQLVNIGLAGLGSYTLNAIGGDYNTETGRNELGMTPGQMAAAEYGATSLFQLGYSSFFDPSNLPRPVCQVYGRERRRPDDGFFDVRCRRRLRPYGAIEQSLICRQDLTFL